MASCEGAILVVDGTQGIQAQTIKNFHLARSNNLVVLPVINKIDMANADAARVSKEIQQQLGIPINQCHRVSGSDL